MTPEQKQLFEDAISLCRSAMSIAGRAGKDTNWAAFASKGMCVLDNYSDLVRTETHRVGFETWVRIEHSFAHAGVETLHWDGAGYTDALVQGAWVSYLAHVPKPCTPTAPCVHFAMPDAPKLPNELEPASEDVVDYPSDDDVCPF